MKLFIAGTDTEVGKTYVSTQLLKTFNQAGLTTLGVKPVASGCIKHNQILYSEDTLALQAASSVKLPHDLLTPFAFEQPIAPHIAATLNQQLLSVENITLALQPALNTTADITLIEGCGGWHTPLNHTETLADFVIAQRLNVILVVGIRLGCINHSLLTLRAMQQDGANIIGWIANCIDPKMKNGEENIETLKHWLDTPYLGTVRHNNKLIIFDTNALSLYSIA